ncbi:hypothetical protein GCM10018771_67640 [Streptomyces cellulosae]|nr:hypothetical protein GCM10018771_67640 [Streptomyces cellulosae]
MLRVPLSMHFGDGPDLDNGGDTDSCPVGIPLMELKGLADSRLVPFMPLAQFGELLIGAPTGARLLPVRSMVPSRITLRDAAGETSSCHQIVLRYGCRGAVNERRTNRHVAECDEVRGRFMWVSAFWSRAHGDG